MNDSQNHHLVHANAIKMQVAVSLYSRNEVHGIRQELMENGCVSLHTSMTLSQGTLSSSFGTWSQVSMQLGA